MIMTKTSLVKLLADWPTSCSLEKGIEFLKEMAEIEDRIFFLREKMWIEQVNFEDRIKKTLEEK